VLVLRYVHEMSTAEIAAVLGKSEGAVRVLVHRALRSVADQLRVDEAASGSAASAGAGLPKPTRRWWRS